MSLTRRARDSESTAMTRAHHGKSEDANSQILTLQNACEHN